ncbi:major facilitator superfamily domain-containing protein [Cantharellus anzutake]|uniref:major facilitator superfamily domain-containing protein n=1 Tax=Cantharellus anzutake TaxID=1750568 RepID=UPI001903A5FA|nr:major facilitator superfamily domain-containing protein [Cantharellus anzutake]KAF8325015.1 major facilitator superfamily domain-containing protein [Cantharellus anzutake]
MIVLSIVVLGEFLSANVSTPFLVDMVKTFNLGDTAELGSFTGIIVAAFFVTQFVTSLLWATIAQKHGNRAVLFISLLGNAITCALFGTCKSFPEAVVVRLIQGVFNGAVGVARSCVVNVADFTNESRAYAIMGFSWGLGGVAGAIIGGAFESPSKTWPTSFGRIPLFQKYPYLLPPLIASSVLLTGAILCLFLGWDGGPREGGIRLPEKDTDNATPAQIDLGRQSLIEEGRAVPKPVEQLKSVKRKISSYFANRVKEAYANRSESPRRDSLVPGAGPSSPASPMAIRSARLSRTAGSAYGHRSRLSSRPTFSSIAGNEARRGSLASTAMNRTIFTETDAPREDLNFAQRLIMANELNATSMTSLWVAAAATADNEDPFIGSDDEMSDAGTEDSDGAASNFPSRFSTIESASQYRWTPHGPTGSPLGPRRSITQGLTSPYPGSRRTSYSRGGIVGGGRTSFGSSPPHGADRQMATAPHLVMPAIYSNTGLRTPPALLEFTEHTYPAIGDPFNESLTPITERSASESSQRSNQSAPDIQSNRDVQSTHDVQSTVEKSENLWSLLPLFIIFQYFVLAIHTTSHDQVFLMYLTSDYAKGGLGLSPGHFAILIGLMCGAQIIYQFYLYPNIGPPRGKYSHLAMFRIGTALFIPGYLTVVLYRRLTNGSSDGNNLIMILLLISTAVRYAGSTFAFTSAAVLLNYLSAPSVIGFANGLAQSLASLARVLGPLLGGWVWSESTSHNPNGYGFGFYMCSALCAVAIFLSFFIR